MQPRTLKILLILFSVFFLILEIYGADVTWSDSGTNFETSVNWGGSVPINDLSADVVIFSSTNPSNQPTLSIDRSVGGLNLSGGGFTLKTDGGSADTLTVGGSNILVSGSSGANSIELNLSGTANLNKSGTSNLTLSGNNSYSGGTIVSNGLLFIGSNDALGTGTVTLDTANSWNGLRFNTDGTSLGNAFDIQDATRFGGQSATIAGAITFSESSGTVLEFDQSGGDIIEFSGVLQDGGSHAGKSVSWRSETDGPVRFSGNSTNSHTGIFQFQEGNYIANKNSSESVNINSGNVQVATSRGAVTLTYQASNQIHDNKNLSFGAVGGSQGTVNLSGSYSEKVNLISINSDSILDFGSTGTANYFLFSNDDNDPDGTLTIKNYELGSDVFAVSNGHNVDTDFLENIQFEGYIAGASTGSTNQSVGSYSGTWDSIVPFTANATWDGSSNTDFNTATNWATDANPASSTTSYIKFSGNTNTTVDLDSDYTLAVIEMDSDASQSFTISSSNNSAFTLNNSNPGQNAKIVQNDDNDHTIQTNLVLGEDLTIEGTGSGLMNLSGVVSGSTSNWIKNDSSTFIISGVNTATVTTTTIREGELRINGEWISDVIVDGGTLSGTGIIKKVGASGDIQVNSGTLSVGNGTDSIGILNFQGTGTSSFNDGSSYVWEISDTTAGGVDSNAGTKWDSMSFSGTLDFGSLSSGGFTIKIENIGSTGINFGKSPGYNQSYKILEAGSLLNFDESYFNLDSSHWTDGGNWWYHWSLTKSGNALYLNYEAVPEAGTYFFVIGIVFILVFRGYSKFKAK